MAGHSKWSQIKHKKALTDAKKSQIFSKLAALIVVAVREKGKDPSGNPKLRMAIEKARSINMPREKIDRAISRGAGDLPGAMIEDVLYEGYGPAGIAILVEALTDNKNRTLAELRRIFSEHGGKLGETGSAKWMFDRITKEDGMEYVPRSPVAIEKIDDAKAIESLFFALDEHQDVKDIYSNARFS